jgi:hypothetical protein
MPTPRDRNIMTEPTAQTNVYSPPKAAIADFSDPMVQAPFYIVSRTKFMFLFAATLGAYGYYWFYRQWKQRKLHGRPDIWPIPRGIFSIFFAHGLSDDLQQMRPATAGKPLLSLRAAATVYVLCEIVMRICDRLSMREIGTPYTDLVSLWMLLPVGYCVWQLQHAANQCSKDPSGQMNDKLTAANYAWIVLGLLLWSLIMIGLLLPE